MAGEFGLLTVLSRGGDRDLKFLGMGKSCWLSQWPFIHEGVMSSADGEGLRTRLGLRFSLGLRLKLRLCLGLSMRDRLLDLSSCMRSSKAIFIFLMSGM